MKRNYNNYSIDNIPNYFIELSNSIKNKNIKTVVKILDEEYEFDDLSYDIIEYYLNILLKDCSIIKHINLIYLYYKEDIYHIKISSNDNKMFKINCEKKIISPMDCL